MVFNPLSHTVEVAAFMHGIEVGKGIRDVLYPVVRDDADVGTAHDVLPKHFKAVVYICD